jgi:hypothetical protein
MAAAGGLKRRRLDTGGTATVAAAAAWLLLARAASATSPTPSPQARAVTIDFVAPKPGSTDAVVGRVNGLEPARNASEFKVRRGGTQWQARGRVCNRPKRPHSPAVSSSPPTPIRTRS